MNLEEEFDELQRLLAQKDLLTEPRPRSSGKFMEILLAKRKDLKIKIYQEKRHALPHIHIDYGKKHHAASYEIATGNRIEGDLPKKYDSDVTNWIERNRENLVKVWALLQDGKDTTELIAKLDGEI